MPSVATCLVFCPLLTSWCVEKDGSGWSGNTNVSGSLMANQRIEMIRTSFRNMASLPTLPSDLCREVQGESSKRWKLHPHGFMWHNLCSYHRIINYPNTPNFLFLFRYPLVGAYRSLTTIKSLDVHDIYNFHVTPGKSYLIRRLWNTWHVDISLHAIWYPVGVLASCVFEFMTWSSISHL